jgi:hypothetical protein
MPAKTDLSFAELAAELPAGAVTYAAGTSDILISVKAVTGDTYAALTDEGVAEALFKIRAAATDAQETVNAAQADGEKLAAFPDFSYGTPVDGKITVSQVSTFVLPLATSTIKGPTV